MHVSYAEYMRVAPDALRIVGYPYLHADDAVECLLWTHAALDRGYSIIRAADRLRENRRADPDIRFEKHRVEITMNGAPLVLYASRIADVAVAETGKGSGFQVLVNGAVGGWVAPYIAARIANAGLEALLRWNPDPNCHEDAPAAVIVAHPGSRASTPLVATSGSWGARIAEAWHVELSGTYWAQIAHMSKHPPGTLAVLASERAENVCTTLSADELGSMAGFNIARLEEVPFMSTLQEWIQNGRESPDDDHKMWASIAARLRLPTSERSRAQAG
jgi:hypothetical protein